jgi:hypothetical protein
MMTIVDSRKRKEHQKKDANGDSQIASIHSDE